MIKRGHLTWTTAITILIFSNLFFLNAQSELPAGTQIRVRMDNGINSKSAGVNDTFTAVTTEPVLINSVPVLPAGSVFVFRITKANPAGTSGKNGEIVAVAETLRLATGSQREVSGELVNELRLEKDSFFSAVSIVGGTAIGGLLGFLAKKGTGAAIGAAAGAGTGTGIAISRKGKNVGIDSGEEFEIRLTKEVRLPAEGF
jgi:hypothetical protein